MSAAIYTRQSSDPTGKAAGVTRQLEENRALAKARGLDVVAELTDNDTSATTGVARPGFERLLELVTTGLVDTVIVWHPDRLYRKLRDLVRITDIASSHGLSVVSVQAGDIDLNTPSGRLVASLVGAVAQHEGEHRTERQRLAYRQRAEQGRWQWTWRPFGYDRVDGKVVQVPEEADALRELYRRYEAGQSRHSLVQWLNDEGIRTSKGTEWSITSLRTMLANPRYFGLSTHNREVVAASSIEWEPVMRPEDYERYTSASAARRRRNTFGPANSLLAGIARCGVAGCEAKAYVKTTGDERRRKQYACTGRGNHVARAQAPLEAHVEQLVLDRLRDPDVLDLLRPRNDGSEQLEREREAVQLRLDDLADLVADGTLRAQAVAERAKPLRARLDEIDALLTRYAGSRALPDGIIGEHVADAWERLTVQQKRAIVRALVVEVRLMPTKSSHRFDKDAVEVLWQG